MTLLSTHRNYSYKYKPQRSSKPVPHRPMKHVLKEGLKKKIDEPKMVSYDLSVHGIIHTVMLPADMDLYTGLSNYFPHLLHEIVYSTEQYVVEQDSIMIEDAWNRMDYLEWLCD